MVGKRQDALRPSVSGNSVWHHGEIVRIEIAPRNSSGISIPPWPRSSPGSSKAFGFRARTLDLEGFRSGSIESPVAAGRGFIGRSRWVDRIISMVDLAVANDCSSFHPRYHNEDQINIAIGGMLLDRRVYRLRMKSVAADLIKTEKPQLGRLLTERRCRSQDRQRLRVPERSRPALSDRSGRKLDQAGKNARGPHRTPAAST